MVIPLLPFYATKLGASASIVGILIAAFSIAQLASAPLWGRFSDRYGRRPALLAGLLISAVAYVIFAYATTLWLLLICRVVQGVGGGHGSSRHRRGRGDPKAAHEPGGLSAARARAVRSAIVQLSFTWPSAPVCVSDLLRARHQLAASSPRVARGDAAAARWVVHQTSAVPLDRDARPKTARGDPDLRDRDRRIYCPVPTLPLILAPASHHRGQRRFS